VLVRQRIDQLIPQLRQVVAGGQEAGTLIGILEGVALGDAAQEHRREGSASSEGTGCDCFGPSELHAALTTGVTPELISVNGSSKDAQIVETAIEAGARITLDSPREYDLVVKTARRLGKRGTIRLRLRPDYKDLGEPSDFFPDLSIRTATDHYKPGIGTGEAAEIGKRALSEPSVNMTGLMVHLGRHSAQSDVWASMARTFADLVVDLSQRWGGWRPKELDIGGGFPSPRDPTSPVREPAPPLELTGGIAARTLRERLNDRGLDPTGITLEAEPGRSLFADTGIHLARVRNVKEQTDPTAWCWVETDTTEMFLADLLIEHARFTPIVANRVNDGRERAQAAVGVAADRVFLVARSRQV